jgi:hypothetical protein
MPPPIQKNRALGGYARGEYEIEMTMMAAWYTSVAARKVLTNGSGSAFQARSVMVGTLKMTAAKATNPKGPNS